MGSFYAVDWRMLMSTLTAIATIIRASRSQKSWMRKEGQALMSGDETLGQKYYTLYAK
jgi:hypothetical protein